MPDDDEREPSLTDEVAQLTRDVAAAAFAQDVDAGVLPATASRPLLPHELAATTNFAELDEQIDRAGVEVQQIMQDLRDDYVSAFISELEDADDPLALVDAVANPAPADASMSASSLLLLAARRLDVAAVAAAAALAASHAAGWAQVHREARQQGVDVPDETPEPPEPPDFTPRTRRVGGEVIAAVNAAAIRRAAVLDPYTPMALEGLREAVEDVTAAGPLADAAALGGGAQNVGRKAALAAVGGERTLYASEVLDRNTCGPCQAVDGTDYAREDDALADYPSGYRSCEGGVRCRGTLVAVWESESSPSQRRGTAE